MSIWTPERITELTAHIEDGLSGNRTADAMGLTAGQVTGKAERMGLKFKSVPGHKRRPAGGKISTSWKPRVEIYAKFPYREKPEVTLEPLNLTLWQLKDSFVECRWITNDDMKAALYCALPVATDDCPYCHSHRKKSLQPHH